MKRNLILSMLACLFLVGALNAQNAQNSQPPQQNMQQRMQQRFDDLKKELVLTKDQNTKFDVIQKETNEKMTAARAAAGDDREAMRTKMTELNKDRDAKFKKILTPAQVKIFDESNAKQAAARAQRGGGGGR